MEEQEGQVPQLHQCKYRPGRLQFWKWVRKYWANKVNGGNIITGSTTTLRKQRNLFSQQPAVLGAKNSNAHTVGRPGTEHKWTQKAQAREAEGESRCEQLLK